MHTLPKLPRIAFVVVIGLALGLPALAGEASVLTTDELSNLRAAYDSTRHKAVAVTDGHEARNPGQRWTSHFDGRGVTTLPDAGGWTWGLQLERYGFAGAERTVCEPSRVSVHGSRVAYDWDATLEEWWVNDASGLEHGYTVLERPPRIASGPLTFALSVRGNLKPSVRADGADVHFTRDGADALLYTGLHVHDADGRALSAAFAVSGSELVLSIEEQGARYPLTIDPTAQQAYLKASNTDANDEFGDSLAVSGDTVVIGAEMEDSNATGVNGNGTDNSANAAGAAYVFVRSGGTWSQQAYLKASNAEANDKFGHAVAISGNTIVVTAVNESGGSTGVNGNQADNSSGLSGAAYVFVRSGTTWTQQAYLKASNTGPFDAFGYSAAISGDTVAIGAHHEQSAATGTGGNQADNSALDAGAVYVFVRSGTTWAQQAYLKASNTDAGDVFGSSVELSNDTLIVGAPQEGSNATGVNGNQADNSLVSAGAAYVFTRSGTVWNQQAYLKASNTDAGDQFGISVAASGNTVAVGANGEASNATGINGNQADDTLFFAGAVYVFTRSGTTWTQQAYVKASNTAAGDGLGLSISLSGDTLLAGATGEDSNATGVNGNQLDNSLAQVGAAYVFARSGTTWTQQAYLKASNSGQNDIFGSSVSISGSVIVIGATREGSSAVGVNGNQADNSATFAGAAYAFSLDTHATSFCFGDGTGTACPCANSGSSGNGCANSTITAGGRLQSSGVASVSAANDTLVLTATNIPGPGLFFQGDGVYAAGLGVAFGDGLLCSGGAIIRMGVVFPTGTTASYPGGTTPNPIHVAGGTAAGDVRNYQCWYRDSAVFCTTATFNLTQALSLTWVP